MDFRLEKLKENLESAVEGMSSEQLSSFATDRRQGPTER